MARRRSKERTPSVDPERVLDGSVVLEVRQLLRLIQDVNPTGRGRDAEATRARYAQKARLQSLLLRRHGAEIEVVPTGAPGVVGLRHVTLREDGGHAIVGQLDPDVLPRVPARARGGA